jgi:hypothetical protein
MRGKPVQLVPLPVEVALTDWPPRGAVDSGAYDLSMPEIEAFAAHADRFGVWVLSFYSGLNVIPSVPRRAASIHG